ncbi:hypothetical protein AB1E18_002956 [Capra hircus]
MSYDRYVAICHPLQYTVIMNWRVCSILAVACWVCGFALALVQVILLLRLPFCGPQKVNHFFCEIRSVLKLACGDIWINEMFLFADGVLILVGPLALMLVSYMRILWAILKIRSKEGRKKAFSTCSSHLCVVGFYFGIAMIVYMVPDNSQREEHLKILFLFYALFNPLLNPLVYSKVNHFLCDIRSVLKLACGDIWINEMFLFADGVLILVGPLALMLVSYMRILWAILKIQSKEGRKKAFSTCSSHLCVVGFYFGIAMIVYMVPDNSQREEHLKILFLFYALFNPLLNPLVYSVRNAQVKAAFHRVLQKKGTV